MKRSALILLLLVLMFSISVSAVTVYETGFENEFKSNTISVFDLPKDTEAFFSIRDADGRQLALEKGKFKNGIATVQYPSAEAKDISVILANGATFVPQKTEKADKIVVKTMQELLTAILEADRNPLKYYVIRISDSISLTSSYYTPDMDANNKRSADIRLDTYGFTTSEISRYFSKVSSTTTPHYVAKGYIPPNVTLSVDHGCTLTLRALTNSSAKIVGDGCVTLHISNSGYLSNASGLSDSTFLSNSVGLVYYLAGNVTGGNHYLPSRATLDLRNVSPLKNGTAVDNVTAGSYTFQPNVLILGFQNPYQLVRPGVDFATHFRDERSEVTEEDAEKAVNVIRSTDIAISDFTTLTQAKALVDGGKMMLRCFDMNASDYQQLVNYIKSTGAKCYLLAKGVKYPYEWTVYSSVEPVLELEKEPQMPEVIKKQQAAVQAALAYYYHDPYIQYDSTTTLTPIGGYSSRGITKLTPEQAGVDNPIYSVCSNFTFRAIKESLDYSLPCLKKGEYFASIRDFVTAYGTRLPADHPLVVYKYGDVDGEQDFATARYQIRNVIEPGDIYVYYLNGDAGHAEMFVGDAFGDGLDYLIDCGAPRMEDDGTDPMDANGAINKKTLHSEFLSQYVKRMTRIDRFIILRPARMPEAYVTDVGEVRLAYPHMEMWKTFTPNSYMDVLPGETITVSLRVKNHSDQDYVGLKLTDPVPRDQEASNITGGGQLSNGLITWVVDVPAGQEKTVTYDVVVTGNRGDFICFESGYVQDVIVTRSARFQIGGKRLTTLEENKFSGMSSALIELADGVTNAPAYVAKVYDYIHPGSGTKMRLNSLSGAKFWETVGERTTYNDKTAYRRLVPKTTDANYQFASVLQSMVLQKHFGGKQTLLDSLKTIDDMYAVDMSDRAMCYWEDYYRIGDVFLTYNRTLKGVTYTSASSDRYLENRTWAQIYIGNGKVLEFAWDVAEDGSVSGPFARIKTFEETIQKNMLTPLVVVLRPSLAGIFD